MLKRGLSSKTVNVFASQILNACVVDFLLSLHVCTAYTHTVAMQVPFAYCMANSLSLPHPLYASWHYLVLQIH